jgi:hypothetical protein
LRSEKTVELVLPAGAVSPLHDSGTGKLDSYFVEGIPVDKVALWARWPTFGALYGAIGINIALIAWILRLAVLEHKFIIGDMKIKELHTPFSKGCQEPAEPSCAEERESPGS